MKLATAVLGVLAAICTSCSGSVHVRFEDPRGPSALHCSSLKPVQRNDLQRLAEATLRKSAKYVADVTVEGGPSQSAAGTMLKLPAADAVASFVAELLRAPLLDGAPLPYTQVRNDCEDRAHVAVAFLLDKHPDWLVGKVFIRGALGSGTKIRWGYHVAPYVITDREELLVIDPAFNGTSGVPLGEWVAEAIPADSVSPTKVDVLLRPADAWFNRPDAMDRREFCEEVEDAVGALRDYEHRNRSTTLTYVRDHLTVRRIDEPTSRVWFSERGKKTGWFSARSDDLKRLVDAHASRKTVRIEYRIVSLGTLKGHFLNIDSVAME